jgi:hypothetical protein
MGEVTLIESRYKCVKRRGFDEADFGVGAGPFYIT